MSSAELMTRRRFVGQVAATGATAAWAGQAAVALAADDGADKPNPVPFRIGAATQVINPGGRRLRAGGRRCPARDGDSR